MNESAFMAYALTSAIAFTILWGERDDVAPVDPRFSLTTNFAVRVGAASLWALLWPILLLTRAARTLQLWAARWPR